MKLKKLMLKSITVLFTACFITGCSENKTDEKPKEMVKGNCTVIECMKKIEASNTVEEISSIIGFEPTESEFSGEKTWKLDSKNWITLKSAGGSPLLQATIDKESIKNENVKLPSQKELQELLNKGVTYEELVEKLGGEGTLQSKSEESVGYVWADKNGQRLGATINNKSKKCTVASYR